MTIDYQTLLEQYKEAGQDHVFQFFDELSPQEQEEFLNQLKSIDVKNITNTGKKALQGELINTAPVEPLPQDIVGNANSEKRDEWYQHGLELISNNQVAVILMAGGQGTRLGSADPKGCYDIGLPSHKSLFQLQAERIYRLQQLASKEGQDAIIPWYIMTSGLTDAPTRDFFERNNYFDLKKENVTFFQQGVNPCLTLDGKFMLQEKGKLAVAPNGNGGIYSALLTEGVINSLKERGIKYSHCYCVDNSLARVADPVFLGYCASRNTDCGVKVVSKLTPDEPVGVVARREGKYGVVEYSEISTELAHQRLENGNLAYGAANIVNHFFSTEFLERVPTFVDELQYHLANKKISYIDTNGELVKPLKPNGVKLERFVFDVFAYSKSFSVLEGNRSEEFSPLKNGPGASSDCPETSRADILKQAERFIHSAGGKFENGPIEIEISPLLSYGGENLSSLQDKTIKTSGIWNNLQDISQNL